MEVERVVGRLDKRTMKRYLLVCCLLLTILLYLLCRANRRRYSREPTAGPRVIHLIYLPWDKNQKLKVDPEDFDHSYYHSLRKKFTTWQIEMWTLPRLAKLCSDSYPGVFEQAMSRASRPTMLVDLFRWIVVHKYGGVYVQYESVLKEDPAWLLPPVGRQVRLLTEVVLTPEQCAEAAVKYPVRQGRHEEPVRVMNQIFSASVPNHPFIGTVWETILRNLSRPIRSDYEVLYASANARVSTLFDEVGKRDNSVFLTNWDDSKSLVKVSSKGSWRTDRA